MDVSVRDMRSEKPIRICCNRNVEKISQLLRVKPSPYTKNAGSGGENELRHL